MDFYERLNSLIKSKGLSQHKLEIELGFSNGAISKWKKYQPQPDRLQKLAEYFGVTMEYLLTGKEKEDSPIYYTNEETAAVAQKLFEDDKVLFDVYRSSDKDRLVEYAKRLKAIRDMEEGNV